MLHEAAALTAKQSHYIGKSWGIVPASLGQVCRIVLHQTVNVISFRRNLLFFQNVN